MEYLFYKRNIKLVWDLKGSQRNRFLLFKNFLLDSFVDPSHQLLFCRMAVEGKKTADLVLLDENLIKDLWNNQLYVHPHSKAALNMAISNDSHFLSAQVTIFWFFIVVMLILL